MNMLIRFPRSAALMLAVGALSIGGCATIEDTLGLGKSSPDETRVTVQSPLVVPPDFGLRPPGYDGKRGQTVVRPRVTARRSSGAVPNGVAGERSNTPDGASLGELAVLRQAGALNPPTGVKEYADQQAGQKARLARFFTNKALSQKVDKVPQAYRPEIDKQGGFF